VIGGAPVFGRRGTAWTRCLSPAWAKPVDRERGDDSAAATALASASDVQQGHRVDVNEAFTDNPQPRDAWEVTGLMFFASHATPAGSRAQRRPRRLPRHSAEHIRNNVDVLPGGGEDLPPKGGLLPG
jgi:hypothetical protein